MPVRINRGWIYFHYLLVCVKSHIDRKCGFRSLHPTDARKLVATIVTTTMVSQSERGICERVNDKNSCVIKLTKTQNTATKDLTTEPSINKDHVEHSKGKKYRPEVLKTTINTISK